MIEIGEDDVGVAAVDLEALAQVPVETKNKVLELSKECLQKERDTSSNEKLLRY